jgi:RHS repeat-associated protein
MTAAFCSIVSALSQRPEWRHRRHRFHRLVTMMALISTFLGTGAARADAQEVIEYYGTDAVGSLRVVFAPDGTVKARSDYLPFGEELPTTPVGQLPTQRFTGQQRDAEEGLDNFNARSYQTRTGRFSSVDPVFAGAVGNPQGWNRYRYAANNPLKFTDPTGMFDTCFDGVCNYRDLDSQVTLYYNANSMVFWFHGTDGQMSCGGARVCFTREYEPIEPGQPDTGGNTGSGDGNGEGTEDPPPTVPPATGTTTTPPPANPGGPVVVPKGHQTPIQNQPPNSVRTHLLGKGQSQVRIFGPDGRATYDIDFGHDHGKGDPHAHRWDWTNLPKRIAITFSEFVNEMKNLATQPIIVVNPCLMSGFSSVCRGGDPFGVGVGGQH